MIKTLTLNPAIDKTVVVSSFTIGEVNRISSVRLDAGGKGINVARVLRRLGLPVLAVAPVAGSSGRFLAGRLAEENIPCALVEVAGESRTNLKVVDPVFGTHTDINEPGPALSPQDLDGLAKRLLDDLEPGDVVVFSGSLPAGVSTSLYGDWISRAKTRGAFTVLDADGRPFAEGLSGRPDLVKPNQRELEAWSGRTLASDSDLLAAVAELRSAGAASVAVSLGSEGAWLITAAGTWRAPGIRVEAQSTVGAGDAFLAALTGALTSGKRPTEALAAAVATATASVVKPGTGSGDPADIERFLGRVSVRQMISKEKAK